MTDRSSRTFYVNGAFVPEQQARISATDLAILRGLGVFESLRTYGGIPFRMPDHLGRLRRSAEAVGITLPWTDLELVSIVNQLLSINKLPEATIRIVVTGGESEDYFHPSGKPGLIVMTTLLRGFSTLILREGGEGRDDKDGAVFSRGKNDQLPPWGCRHAGGQEEDPDVVEVLFVDRNNCVTEGITSNCFVFIGGSLVTPGEKILEGVTRQVVLELARDRYPVEIRDLTLLELREADEVFLTGSVKEILPVSNIDGTGVGAGRRGPRTRRLQDAFRDLKDEFISRKEVPRTSS